MERVIKRMYDFLSKDGLSYIISCVIECANDTMSEYKKQRDNEFLQGKMLAYYEVLDTIKNRLIVRDAELQEFGLDIDLDKMFDTSN